MQPTVRFALRHAAATICLAVALMGNTGMAHAQQPIEIDAAPPEFVGGPWLNATRNMPIKLAARKGEVTIVEFWTFG